MPLIRLPLLIASLTLCFFVTTRADVVISEFVANNNTGLVDDDGDRGDWIELYNNGSTVEDLAGWRLTDDAGDLEKWVFPGVTLEPKGFLVVFASSKDRANAAAALHTNFKLSADGGYLALVRANGSLSTEFNPYPAQYDDKPYGFGQSVTTTTLISPTASLKYLVPTIATPDNPTWTARTFVDSAWTTATNGIGFETTVPGFAFRTYFANVGIGNITTANNVIATPSLQTQTYAETRTVVNYLDSGGDGHYAPQSNPIWANGSAENYVVEATGIVTIPTAGVWTLGVNSDDGFQLQVRPVGSPTWTTVCSFDGGRGVADTLGTNNFTTAGDYEIRVMIYEGGGGSAGEAFAKQGNSGSWDSGFRLIGDTAAGGLAVRSIPIGTGGSGYTQFIGAGGNTKAAMFDAPTQKSSAYLRYSFTNPGGLTSLSLPIRYDDGIAVYLNGTLVKTRQAPPTLTNTSVATADRATYLAKQPETLDLTPHLGLLTTNPNVIAIHALNQAASNGDFLIKGELYQYTVTTTPTANSYTTATPGSFNNSAVFNKVAPVVASVGRGFYSTAQTVTLTTGTAGATIRYTFDGSTPVETNGSSATYTAPITINSTRTLRYRAFKAGSEASDSGTQTYIFTADVINQQPTGTLPVITNPAGATQATTTWPGTFDTNTGKYQINGQELDFGMDPDVVTPNSATIQNDLKSIPAMSIVTDLSNLFDSANGIYVNPGGDGPPWERPTSIELINPDGTPGFGVNAGLRLRGGFSRSSGNPKHAFRLFFRDSYGPSKLNYPLHGEGVGTDVFDKFDLRTAQNYSWSFGGDSSGDFVQDPLARDQQLAMGHPSSHGRFFHLYVNGIYWGLYNVDERPEAFFGQTYFGGSEDDFDAVKTVDGYVIAATDGNTDAWSSLWTLADGSLAAANSEAANNTTYQRLIGRNPDGSVNATYPVLFDAVNTSDAMLVVFWGGNLDAQISNFLGNTSPNNTYFMRDRTGASGGFKSILHDSEHTLRNVNENRLGPWPAGSSTVADGGGFSKSTPQYAFQQCMNALEFRVLFADRTFRHCFNGGVLTPAVALEMFNARTTEIDRAVVAESARWGDSKSATPLTRDNWLNACNNVRGGFIAGRTNVLISQLRTRGWYPTFDPPVFSQRGGTVPTGSSITLTFGANTPGGSILYYTLDGTDPRLLGGNVAPTALSIVSGGSITIPSSRLIRVRTKSGTTWSAIDEATFYVTQDFSPLALTEVNYNPLPTSVGGTDGGDYDFLEFKNTGAVTLDLGGLTFDTGLTYTFAPGTTLAPGAFFVLVKNSTKFSARYPGVPIGGTFTSGGLSDGGESLTLITAAAGGVLTVDYNDAPPWPAAADGHGFSLVPANTNYNSDTGSDWRASANLHGSPGTDDPAVSFAPITINEALTNSVLPLRDTIELHNPTGAPVNVGDWWLSDDRDTPQKYRVPTGTTIPANGFVTFHEAQFNPTPGVGASFALSGTGDDVYLFSGNPGGALTGYSHGWDFAAAEADVSFGRYVTSVGEEHFPRQVARTFGVVNTGPLVGPLVLNEIMYHPFVGYDEYIEIRNLTGSAVSLDGPSGTTWKISGINYTFAAGQSVPANGYALVVGTDPVVFRSKYAVPAAVPIFGPYAGVLQDSGERLSLEKPETPYINSMSQTVTPYVVIDSVRYNDKTPWPVAADGDGPSLQRLTSSAYADDPVNWFASGATPGIANSVNQAPTVALTGPASGTGFTLPATVNFTATASDNDGSVAKVEFYVDGLKVGEDITSPYALSWSATGGVHTCTAVAIDNALGITTSAPITVLVTTPVAQGLKAVYYPNIALSEPATLIRTDATVNFDDYSGTWVNSAGIGTDVFSVRWSGQVRPTTSGTYTFFAAADDGVRLYVNGQTLVNSWILQGETEYSGTFNVTAGQLYTITMEMFENYGGAAARLRWEGPGVAKAIIPQSALYPDSAPIIITQPTNSTVEAGANATFSVLASGIGNSYQWRKGTVNIPGATSATLTIQQTITSDAGSYNCLVSNTGGFAASNSATLTVNFTDTDGDGMQNSWETLYGLNPNSSADAAQDKDGDGETNKEEFLAGTNPNVPSDVLKPTITKITDGWKITFTAQSRKSYTVQYKNALNAASWTNLQTITEQFGVRTIEVTDLTTVPQRFYRVETPSQ